MADLDTQNKRRSASNMILFVINPVADGTIDDNDREQASGIYAGIDPSVITAYARISQSMAEIIRDGDPYVRPTYVATEIIRDGDPYVRPTLVAVEILRSAEMGEATSSFFLVMC